MAAMLNQSRQVFGCAMAASVILRFAVAQSVGGVRAFDHSASSQPPSHTRSLLTSSAGYSTGTAPFVKWRPSSGPSMKATVRSPRIATAVSKFCVEVYRAAVAEAQECAGGNGFVEDKHNAATVSRGAPQFDRGRLGQRIAPSVRMW
jgi:hypothetical protein